MIAEVVCCSGCMYVRGSVHEVESEGEYDKANVDSYKIYNGEALYCKHD